MKKVVVLLAASIAIAVGAGAACAAVQAKDALIAYVGTEAFTQLTAEERQACVEWLAEGGTMKPGCKRAVMRLVAIAPDAIPVEQRQALIATAAGTSVSTASSANADTPVIVQKDDDAAGAAIVGGLVGLLAGLVIANNTHRHYAPAPPRPRPPEAFRGPGGPGPGKPGPGRVPAGNGPKRPQGGGPKPGGPKPPRR